MSERLITKNELDYCIKCGCPLDVCCGQGKVTLEEHEQLKNACDSWSNKVRFFEDCCNKKAFKDISGREFVSLEWLEMLIKNELKFLGSLKPEYNELEAYHEGQYNILLWVLKKAKKESEKEGGKT